MTRIVPLTGADFDEWLPLWRGYQTFYKVDIADDTTRTTFARLTDGKEPMGAFLARNDAGKAIGVVHWIMHRSCWTTGDYCYLQDLFVAPDIRGGGGSACPRPPAAPRAAWRSRCCARPRPGSAP